MIQAKVKFHKIEGSSQFYSTMLQMIFADDTFVQKYPNIFRVVI